MKQIHYSSTLFYYDGPQVFDARDAIGGHYVAVAVPAGEGQDRYLLRGVAPEALGLFRSGRMDLRSLLLNSSEEDWYLATFGANPDESLRLESQGSSQPKSAWLPNPGFFLHRHPSTDDVVERARRENTLVVEIRADSPQAAMEHRVAADTLAGILSGFQALVRHSHRRATRGLGSGSRPPGSDTMEVLVPAAPGSFRVILASAHPPKPNLFGDSFLKPALKRIDTVFEHAEDPSGTVAHLRENRGHFAGATLKLLRFLNQRHTGLRYAWADQHSDRATRLGVTHSAAARIVEASVSAPEIATETVTLTGRFQKINRRTGVWGLLTEHGPVGGRLRQGGPDLDGLEVGGRYRFVCEERIETTRVSRKDTPTRTLVSHEPAPD